MLSRFVTVFLLRSQYLLTSWLKSPSTVILEPKKRKSVTASTFSPTRLKRPWCWERLKAGGEGDDRGWDDWMASLTQWTWVWVNSGSWRWTGRPDMLQSMGSQRVGHDWANELNWICCEVMEPDAMILVCWILSLKPAFSVCSFTLIKRLFSSSSLSAIRVASSAYLRLLIFLPHEQYEKAKSFLPKMSIYFFNFTSGNRNFLEQFWIGTAIHFLKKIKRNLVLCIHNVEKWN